MLSPPQRLSHFLSSLSTKYVVRDSPTPFQCFSSPVFFLNSSLSPLTTSTSPCRQGAGQLPPLGSAPPLTYPFPRGGRARKRKGKMCPKMESHTPAESRGVRWEPMGRGVSQAALLLLCSLQQPQPLPQQRSALPTQLLSLFNLVSLSIPPAETFLTSLQPEPCERQITAAGGHGKRAGGALP